MKKIIFDDDWNDCHIEDINSFWIFQNNLIFVATFSQENNATAIAIF
jgi:hypothetical protein